MNISIITIIACSFLATGVRAAVLFDFGANPTEGWNSYTQSSGASFSTSGPDITGNGNYTVSMNAMGGNFFNENADTTTTWATGMFDGVAGTALDEMQKTLGLSSPIGTSVWGDSLHRGNDSGNTLTISGLTAGTSYTFYCIVGNNSQTSNNSHSIALSGTNANDLTSASYFTTGSNGAYSTAANATTSLSVNGKNIMLVKLENVVADADGNVAFTLGGRRAAINAVAFTETVPEPATAAMGLLGAAALMMRRRKA